MCSMQESVRVVADHELGVAWAAAVSDDGRRVVFIRESDQWMIQAYCAAGAAVCPVFQALTRAA